MFRESMVLELLWENKIEYRIDKKIENKEFQDRIEPLVSDHKKELFKKVLDQRTRHITVVIEDVFQSQNASAVLRSCDCFGIQDVHIIENRNEYKWNINEYIHRYIHSVYIYIYILCLLI